MNEKHCEVCGREISFFRTVCDDCLELYRAVSLADDIQIDWLRKYLEEYDENLSD